MKKQEFGMTEVRLTKELMLHVEWYRYAEERSHDRDVPGEPEIYEIDTVWLVERYTDAVIDVTDLEGTLWQHDEVLQIVEGDKR